MNSTNEDLTQLSDLIGLIYEGATDPGRWTKDILPAVAEYIQAPECILFTNLHTPQNGGYFFIHGMTQDHVDLYMNKYHNHDVWTTAALEKNLLTEGSVLIGDDLVPRQQLLESKIYKECLSRDENMAQLMACMVFGNESGNSKPTAISFFRGLHHPDFNAENIQRMILILPHLSRSLGVMQRLRTAELTVATSLAALDRLSSGVLLLDESGAVAFANRSAKRMLEDGDGLRLCKRSNTPSFGRLIAENDASTNAINDAVRATLDRDPYATPHFSNCVTVPRSSGLANFTLQFSALGDHHEFVGGSSAFAVIIFIADGAQEIEIDPAMLQSAYSLTPAEAKVAVTLLQCSSAQEVATKLGTSLHTVNTQIKQIYSKLGVDTRTRFIKLLLGLARHRT